MSTLITLIAFVPLILSIIAFTWSIKYTYQIFSLRRKEKGECHEREF